MRTAFIIIGLTAIAVGLVHIRRQEVVLRHEIQRMQSEHTALRREIWDRQVQIGHLLAPRAVKQRSETMALDLTTQLPAQASMKPGEWNYNR